MKRFYKAAGVAPAEGGWTVTLDDRPVRTPARQALVLPTKALAQAVADEWMAQTETIRPATMPLTGLANAAIDRVASARAAFIDGLAAYGDSDVICYRAEHPADLATAQSAAWDPLIAWASARYDAAFEITTGVLHRPQPTTTLARLQAALEALDDFALTAMQPLVTVSGSLVIALAVLEGRIDPDEAWRAGQLDELYQAEAWGNDPLAAEARANRRASLEAAVRFLGLLA